MVTKELSEATVEFNYILENTSLHKIKVVGGFLLNFISTLYTYFYN